MSRLTGEMAGPARFGRRNSMLLGSFCALNDVGAWIDAPPHRQVPNPGACVVQEDRDSRLLRYYDTQARRTLYYAESFTELYLQIGQFPEESPDDPIPAHAPEEARPA